MPGGGHRRYGRMVIRIIHIPLFILGEIAGDGIAGTIRIATMAGDITTGGTTLGITTGIMVGGILTTLGVIADGTILGIITLGDTIMATGMVIIKGTGMGSTMA